MNASKVIINLFDSGCGTSDISKTLGISKKKVENIYTKEIRNFIAVERWNYQWTRLN